MSHPRGKIEIFGEIGDGMSPAGQMLFKFHQNKYQEDTSRIFSADVSDTTTWLDDSLRAM